MHQHLKIKELVAAAHDAAPELPPAAARLMRDVASRLDVTFSALCEKSREVTAYEATVTNLTAQVQGLAAENANLSSAAECLLHEASEVYRAYNKTQLPDGDLVDGQSLQEVYEAINSTPATDAALAEIRNEARAEGIYFTANRMLAAWDAGFINSPAKEVIDVARMILSAADMLKDATQADFSRKFADEIMAEMVTELRKEQGK